jgi:RluA family pseudouridine synthase
MQKQVETRKKQEFFSIIYDDEYIAAVNKSSGIAVTPDRWDISAERLDRLVQKHLALKQLSLAKIFTVHRLDKETSGVVVFAKDEHTHKNLSAAFENRQVIKRYIAVVCGRPSWKETSCDLPLVPNGNKAHHTIVDKYRGKKSFTSFRLLGTAGNYSVVEALPETGRTHQIRVHAAALGHAVVCDNFYGRGKPLYLSGFKRGWRGDPHEERPLISRLALHALQLTIPSSAPPSAVVAKSATKVGANNALTLTAPLSRDIAALIRQMEKVSDSDFGI